MKPGATALIVASRFGQLRRHRFDHPDHARLRGGVVGLARVAGDPRHRGDADDAAVGVRAGLPSSSASLIRSSLERLISISCAQRSSGIFAIVRSLVTPALWTTTSTPPAKSLGDRAGRVVGGDVERDRARRRSRPTTVRRSVGRLRDVEADDARRRRGRASSAIAAPIPREAPVTSADLAGQRRSQSISGDGGDAFADADHLAGDVGRARREQEAQGRLELVLGAGLDVDELRGRALAADLLAERADEALERALRGGGAGRARVRRRGAEDDDAAAALAAGRPPG